MQSIEDKAILNYQENMKFFEEKHTRLHGMLVALETLLNEGKYPQKYELEYKNSYFDVLELSSQTYLYNQDSKKYSDTLIEGISFKKDDQVFESFYNFNYNPEAVGLLKKADAYFPHSTTAEIISYHQENIDVSMNMMKVYKFIFIGVGLGLHIKNIIKKISAEVILITDNDIELFRLSMFTCNYKEALGSKTAFFSIAQNPLEFAATFQSFFEIAIIRNHYLKFSLFSSKDQGTIKEIQKSILTRPEKCYSHSRLLEKSKNLINRLNKDYKFLNLQKKVSETFFDDKPILVLGAGPSLHAEVEWLKSNYKDFVIVAPLAAVQVLYKLNISPDIVVHIDENVPLAKRELDSFDDKNFFNNSVFIFTASVAEIFFDTFEKEQIYLLEDRTSYKLNHCFIDAASVGEACYGIALSFTNKDMYILGLDLALGDDGSSHAKDHSDYVSIDTSSVGQVSESETLDRAVTEIKGNFRSKVKTIPLLAMSIPVVNIHTQNLKSENQKIYNLSDGAFFENTIPAHSADIHLGHPIERSNFKSQLITLFDSYSSMSLSKEEIEELIAKKGRLTHYHDSLTAFKESSSANEELLMQNYVKLLDSMVNYHQDELHQIMINYLLNTTTYISDFFNTKELKNKKTHIKKIKKIIIALMEKVIKAYDLEISKIVDEVQHAQ